MNVTSKRNDIQGLRAVAVVAVVLYHFGIGPFTGGFVGVDVFFVISGYLITAKIAREAKEGRFSFIEFCAGRARRLLPALFTTIAIAFVVGALLFSPLDFQRQSAATVAAVLGVSNVLFWYEAGYFDAAAILKPLLHTWSLAVELQFYVVWPFVVMFLVRGRLVPGTMLLVLAGFTAAIWMMRYDPTAAFFLTPFRMWEFAAGGLVYALERRNFSIKPISAAGIYLAGMVAIIYPIFALTSDSEFPGWSAALPVAGTAVMILAGPYTAASKGLQTWPSRWLGEISYSVYLVHWPLVVFVQYYVVRGLNHLDKAALLVATMVLSVALYLLVEQPLRRPWRGRIKPAVALPALAALVIVPASSSWAGNGWSWRVPDEIRAINEIDIEEMKTYVWERHEALKGEHFDESKTKILVIGDSMSADLVNMLFESPGAADNVSVRTIRLSRFCAALYIPPENRERFWKEENDFTANRHTAIKGCMEAQDQVFNSPLLPQADVVFVSHLWFPWATPYLGGTLAKFKEITGGDVYFVGRKDLLKGSIEIVNERGTLRGIEEYAALQRDPEADRINHDFGVILGDHFIDMMAVICPSAVRCTPLSPSGTATFWDKAHVTPAGAALFGQRLVEIYGFPTMK